MHLFFHCLTPEKQNYGVVNCELLAIKLALEERRHWLEGAEQLFVIWTSHKNLACIFKVQSDLTKDKLGGLYSLPALTLLLLTDLCSFTLSMRGIPPGEVLRHSVCYLLVFLTG